MKNSKISPVKFFQKKLEGAKARGQHLTAKEFFGPKKAPAMETDHKVTKPGKPMSDQQRQAACAMFGPEHPQACEGLTKSEVSRLTDEPGRKTLNLDAAMKQITNHVNRTQLITPKQFFELEFRGVAQ